MKARNFLLVVLVIVVIALVITLYFMGTGAPRVQDSTLVVCTSQIVQGGTIEYYTYETTNGTTERLNAGGTFFPQATITEEYMTNLTVSATPGYTTSLSDLGQCVFAQNSVSISSVTNVSSSLAP